MPGKEYLGDSVYVDVRDEMLVLTTENGLSTDPSNVIYLEPEILRALVEYHNRLPGVVPLCLA